MERESNKAIARHVREAVIALKDTRGSTAKDIKKYLVSQGQISLDTDIRPAILSALKAKQLTSPEGSKGRFMFWEEEPPRKSKEKRKCSSCSKRQRCCRRRRRRRSCRRRRRRRRCCRRRRRHHHHCRKGHRRLDKRQALKKISSMKIPTGKQLVVFCARRGRKRK
ncbi:histone H1, gonadal-like [Biomphalaria glabrata]|uniref:Histone H1, gonadal-like n=1 Tax=Biomphalaria glabrata TaxID=6526 RepID=A0A2C9MAL8_BIOGL|nr:histone H1, gonadal-like [Biomphalaria glabrata]